jgi:hypothetical protein
MAYECKFFCKKNQIWEKIEFMDTLNKCQTSDLPGPESVYSKLESDFGGALNRRQDFEEDEEEERPFPGERLHNQRHILNFAPRVKL